MLNGFRRRKYLDEKAPSLGCASGRVQTLLKTAKLLTPRLSNQTPTGDGAWWFNQSSKNNFRVGTVKGKHAYVLRKLQKKKKISLQPECDEDWMQSDWHNIARESMVGIRTDRKIRKQILVYPILNDYDSMICSGCINLSRGVMISSKVGFGEGEMVNSLSPLPPGWLFRLRELQPQCWHLLRVLHWWG